MNDADDKDRLFIARCSLVLFIAGLLVPIIIFAAALIVRDTMLSPESEWAVTVLAVAFGVIAEVLALILGIIGRRHLSGRIGMNGSIILFVLLLLAAVAWSLYSDPGRPGPQPNGEPARTKKGVTPPDQPAVEPEAVPPEKRPSGDEQIP